MYDERTGLKWNMLFSNLQAILQWGNQTPSCQRNVFINLRSKYAPACSAGRVRTLQLPSCPPSCLYLLGSERNRHTCTHAHVHARTHASWSESLFETPLRSVAARPVEIRWLFTWSPAAVFLLYRDWLPHGFKSLAGRQQKQAVSEVVVVVVGLLSLLSPSANFLNKTSHTD